MIPPLSAEATFAKIPVFEAQSDGATKSEVGTSAISVPIDVTVAPVKTCQPAGIAVAERVERLGVRCRRARRG